MPWLAADCVGVSVCEVVMCAWSHHLAYLAENVVHGDKGLLECVSIRDARFLHKHIARLKAPLMVEVLGDDLRDVQQA